MRHWRVLLVIVATAMTISALYQLTAAQPAPTSYDTCVSEFHRSFPVSAATSGTFFGAHAASNPNPIVICAQQITVASGAGSSYALVAGTTSSTPCDTNQQMITGAYASNPPGTDGRGTIATAPTGYDVCYKTTGAGAVGVVSYVQVGQFIETKTQTQTPTPTKTPTATPT